MDELIAPVLRHLDEEDSGDVVGVYLYGSAVTTGLRPGSDVDLLVLTRHSLTTAERTSFVALLMSVSGWFGHAARFPEVAHRRPIELTSLVVDDMQAWSATPRCDFQYGEWLREELTNGHIPFPTDDPDIVTLLATAQSAHEVLRGPSLSVLVPPVPIDLLRNAALVSVSDVLGGIEGDERNALLTLARILVTLETGEIVSKDAAVDVIAPTLGAADRDLLERAGVAYRRTTVDDWTGLAPEVTALAHTLAGRARQYRSR